MASDIFVVTTSWDDGHPADLRLSELLQRHGVSGTFYVPTSNIEGHPVLSERDVRAIANAFEIGGHGTTHEVLTTLSRDLVEAQVRDNKRWLESVIGRKLEGFCYVRGQHNAEVRRIVQAQGYRYARTVKSFSRSDVPSFFELPTTVQMFPHKPQTYVKGLVRARVRLDALRMCLIACSTKSLERRIEKLANYCRTQGAYFHLWGHSWEVERLGLWDELDRVIRHLRTVSDHHLTNGATVAFLASGSTALAHHQR